MNKRESCHCHAFTLIELVVVITVIAILAALLLPALARSKINAQQVDCLSNVRQLAAAGLMYMADNDRCLDYYSIVQGSLWMGLVTPFGVTDKALLCPTAPNPQLLPLNNTFGTADLAWIWGENVTLPLTGSYGFNGWLYSFGGNPPPFPMAVNDLFSRPSSVQQPSRTPLFFDEIWADTWPMETDSAAHDLYTGKPNLGGGRGMGCCTLLRHGGKTATSSYPFPLNGQIQALPGAINLGLADGHVELSPLRNLWNYYWHLNWNPALLKGS
jgi:prepilin-type N-terminal cleavage/methylation domain-containing protein